jgi:cystathionine beta-lyase/cystathionine gamma-synthase
VRFDTRLVHVGQEVEPGSGDVVPPVHVSASYEQRAQDPPRHFYSRGENPTRERLERCLASLEEARFALAFSSGQAAGATALSLLDPGQRLLASDDVYGGTRELFALLARCGVEVCHLDLTDPAALERALGQDVGLVWIETPTNPLLKVTDLADACRRCRAAGVRVLVDNTFASPALQQPLRHGADMSLHSTTKLLSGHSDVLGGALVYNDPDLHERFLAHRTTTGAVPGAFDCFLVHRGIKTLTLRVARQVANATALVDALQASPAVRSVFYPGLPEHPSYRVARRQMAAPGSVVTFACRGDPERVLARVRLFCCAVSLGGVRSLVERPATMTHRSVPRAQRLAVGVTDDLIRVSAGIEDPADLVEDLLSALAMD